MVILCFGKVTFPKEKHVHLVRKDDKISHLIHVVLPDVQKTTTKTTNEQKKTKHPDHKRSAH